MESDIYLINSSTLMLKYISEKRTRVYELNRSFVVSENISDIIFNSCEFYGSNYNGRLHFSKTVLNLKIKVPIVVEDNKKIIFFPTRAIENRECIWISFNNLDKVYKELDSSIVVFRNGKKYKINLSSDIIDRQFYNCLRLEKMLKSRQENA